MREIGFTLLFVFGGIVAAVFYAFIIGFAGIPGALLSSAATKRSVDGVTPVWGLSLTVAGQLYASLAFVVLVIQFVEARLDGVAGLGKWIAWGVAFFIALLPPAMVLQDAARVKRRNIQHTATTFTAPLTAIGFILFLLFPVLMKAGWDWVPKF